MKALFLIRDLPDPPDNGYKKRNFYLIKALEARGVEVIVKIEDEHGSKMKALFFSLFSALPFSVKFRTSDKIRKNIANYLVENPVDIIICDAVQRALNIPHDNTTLKVLYEHNIESVIFKRYAENERNIFKKIFAFMEYIKLSNFEKKMWKRFDCSIACSELDKKAMERRVEGIKVFVIKNGVDSEFFKPGTKLPIDRNKLVYTGQIGWHPNEDAITYFVNEIFQRIKKEMPLATLCIVGKEPSAKIRALAEKDASITVTGFVEDVRPFIAKAGVYIVPLRVGAGTRLKILEALSMKKAVVSTSIGCEGLDVIDGEHLLIRDTPDEFAKAVLELMKNDEMRQKLGESGRRLVEEQYDWDGVFKELDVILK